MQFYYHQIDRWQRQLGNSFYFLDLDKVEDNYQRFSTAFQNCYANSQVAYSFKTNYTPAICSLLKQQGALAEVVSAMEYDMALMLGYKADAIIVNGALHKQEFVRRILLDGVRFNVDGWQMLQQVSEVCREFPQRDFAIGLRMNYPVLDAGHSRFGFSSDTANINQLSEWLKQHRNCRLAGLHSHYSNSSRSLDSFKSRTEGLLSLLNSVLVQGELDYLDLGGGFLGAMPESLALQVTDYVPEFEEYAEVTARVVANDCEAKDFNSDNMPTLYLEPGTALVADTMAFITPVVEIKQIGEKRLALVDGSNHNINHRWGSTILPVELAAADSNRNKAPNKNLPPLQIVGNTCIEKDCLIPEVSLDAEQGDYLVFPYAGAYTNVLKQPFIHPCQGIMASYKGNTTLVKRQENAVDVLKSYLPCDPPLL